MTLVREDVSYVFEVGSVWKWMISKQTITAAVMKCDSCHLLARLVIFGAVVLLLGGQTFGAAVLVWRGWESESPHWAVVGPQLPCTLQLCGHQNPARK